MPHDKKTTTKLPKDTTMARNKSWFKMLKQSADVAEIEIFDEIDSFWGLGPKEFKARFDEVKDAKTIKLQLNSVGGSVFDGMAIYNILATARDRLEVEIVGLAASISSIIALAGNKLTMAEGSYFMIHNPWTFVAGGADDLRKTADLLEKMKGEFVSIYEKNSTISAEKIGELMDAETWMTAAEAVEMGFADDTADYGELAAKVTIPASRYGFNKIPDALACAGDGNHVATVRELESLLRDAGGFSKRDAVAIASQGWKALGRGDPDAEDGAQRGDPARVQNDSLEMLIREREIDIAIRSLA